MIARRRGAAFAAWFAVAGSLAACGDAPVPEPAATSSAPADAIAREPVVDRAIAALSASLPRVAEPPAVDADLVNELTQVLANAGGDARLRELPLEEIRGMGDGALPDLSRIAADPEADANVRAAAIELIAAVGSRAAGLALVELCDSRRETWVRRHAAWRASELPIDVDVVVPGLLLRLRSETDHEAAIYVASALARHANFAGVEMLQRLVTTGSDDAARQRAAAELARVVEDAGAPDAATLIAWWTSGAPELPTHEPSDPLRLAAWQWIRTLSGDTFQLRPVDDARFILSRLGAWAVAPLAEALADQDPYVRLHAAQCLERMDARARDAVPALEDALDDPRLAAQAARALGAIGGDGVREVLVAATGPGPHERRVAAVRAFELLGDDATVPHLDARLADDAEPYDLRQTAAESILALAPDHAAARAFLVASLTEPAADVGGAERALADWLAARADDASLDELRAAWDAADVAAGAIPTSSESTARRAARRRAFADHGE